MTRFLVLIFIILTSTAYADIAEIIYVRGNVTVIKDDESGVPAKKGMKLKEGHEVETQKDSMAIVAFLGASKIKVDPDSKLVIEDHRPESSSEQTTFTRFYLQWGAAVIDFFNDKKKHELEIKTRQTAIAVRGTNFFVGYGDGEERGDVYTYVNEGKVSALNYEKDDYENIPTGSGILVNKNGRISRPEKFEWAKNLNWKVRPEVEKISRTGFRSKTLRQKRLAKRKQLLEKLKKRKRKPFKELGEFKSWVKNRDRIEKKIQQRKKIRNKRIRKLRDRRQKFRQNRNKRNQQNKRDKIKKLRKKYKN